MSKWALPKWFSCVYCVGSAVLAHFFLKEKLQKMGVLGCVLCVVGSTMIVLHAPGERSPSSVDEIWELATQPSKLLNISCCVLLHGASFWLFCCVWFSFPSLYGLGNSYCVVPGVVLRTPLWTDKHTHLHWDMFHNRILDGQSLLAPFCMPNLSHDS